MKKEYHEESWGSFAFLAKQIAKMLPIIDANEQTLLFFFFLYFYSKLSLACSHRHSDEWVIVDFIELARCRYSLLDTILQNGRL